MAMMDESEESLLEDVLGILRRNAVANKQRLQARPDIPQKLFEGNVDLKVVQGTHLSPGRS
jgi:hypothetical protein